MATRVAIYARVSTGEQSAEAQLRELRAYTEHRGFQVIAADGLGDAISAEGWQA